MKLSGPGKLILLFCVALLRMEAAAQTHKYDFGATTVETGPCRHISGLKIFSQRTEVFSECTEAAAYTSVDTLSLNDDGIPDLVVGVLMEEYYVIEVKLSHKGTYVSYELDQIFPADTYAKNFRLFKGEKFQPFIVRDIDGDGRRDIVTNVVLKGKDMRTVPQHSRTIKYPEVKKRISQAGAGKR